jgi:GH18 family chitinase
MASRLGVSRRQFLAATAVGPFSSRTEAPPPAIPPGQTASDLRVIGYYPLYKAQTYPPDTLPFSAVTDVVAAFLKPTSDGAVVLPPDSAAAGPLAELMTETGTRPNTRFHLAVGGRKFSDTFAPAVATASNQATFADTAVDLVAQYGAHGLHLNLEYPETASEASNYVDALSQCRDALDALDDTFELTIAVGGREYADGVLPHQEVADLVEAFIPVAVEKAGGFAGFRETVTKTNSLMNRL